jgi:3-methylcrotonyl-CoA carboxylase alpha subunit
MIPNTFNVLVHTTTSPVKFLSVHAELVSQTKLKIRLQDKLERTTIVSQQSPSPSTMERLHVFSQGAKTTLLLPSPMWMRSSGGKALATSKGILKAPMPSLVVDVPVRVGDMVEKGQTIVVLESMKTETVLRSDLAGVVKLIGCKKGEMVQEGKELVVIEEGT